jgi:hypothetical protein
MACRKKPDRHGGGSSNSEIGIAKKSMRLAESEILQ